MAGAPRRSGQGRAACTSSAPSATSRGASTTSCAAAPGRQGDPGSSRFYLSLEDPLLRIFGGERLGAIMQTAEDARRRGDRASDRQRARSRRRRRKVEARNFDIRKQLLEYDDVANDQRKVIYQQRNELLEGDDVADTIRNMSAAQVERHGASCYVPPESRRGAVGHCRPRDGARRRIPARRAGRATGSKTDAELTDEDAARTRRRRWPTRRSAQA